MNLPAIYKSEAYKIARALLKTGKTNHASFIAGALTGMYDRGVREEKKHIYNLMPSYTKEQMISYLEDEEVKKDEPTSNEST